MRIRISTLVSGICAVLLSLSPLGIAFRLFTWYDLLWPAVAWAVLGLLATWWSVSIVPRNGL